MSALDLDLAILGPVEARTTTGETLTVPRGRPLALLALLVIHRSEVVPRDTAVDAVWGEDLPRHPRNALQLAISRIRSALRLAPEDADVLAERGGGYVLQLVPGTLDADRFEILATAGRAQLLRSDVVGAASTLRQALDLWRGPVLLDVRDEQFAQAEIGRLEELRLAVLGDRIDADLALGRHADLAGELPGLVEAHPWRETLRAQLMLALYGSGRRAEALAAYREARRTMVDELGIEPSQPLRDVERLVLQGGPAPGGRRQAGQLGSRRRHGTCLVVEPVDIEDLTARLDPEALQRVLLELRSRVRGISVPFGGTARGSDDGSVLLVFGWPASHEDDALRAVRAADALRGVTVAGSALRVGLATREILTPEQPGSPLLLGDAAAHARRLAHEADPGEVLIAASTWALVRDAAEGRPVSASAAWSGSDREGTAFVLTSITADAILDRRGGGPLVGRDAELDVLLAAMDSAVADDTSRLVTVLGEPGIGKTRLSLEVARRCSDRAIVLRGTCRPYGESLAFSPLREIVAQASRGGDVEQWAVGLGLEPPLAQRVAAAFGLAEGVAGEEAPWAFRRLVAALAARRPVVLVVDDIHAAQPELLDLLERLTGMRGAAVLLICLARPELVELRPTWGAARQVANVSTTLPLHPLDETQSRALVGRLLDTARGQGSTGLDDWLVDEVVGRAGGNPLFLEQLFRHVTEAPPVDAGRLGQPDRDPVLVSDVPPALQALLAARLDLVPVDERAVLESGAVEGETFHLTSVLAMRAEGGEPAQARRQTERLLDSLIRRDLIAPAATDLPDAGPTFAFRHKLVRDAAYAALSRAGRAALHERHAAWLARLDPPVPDSEARLGFHLECAHDHLQGVGESGERTSTLGRRAGEHLVRAAWQAHRRSDLAAEIGLLERAVRLLGADSAEGARTLPALAAALDEAGTFTRAAEVAALGVRAGAELHLPSVFWNSTVERERTRLYSCPEEVDVTESLAVAEQAATRLAELGDDLGVARVEYLTAELVFMLGRPDTAMTHVRRQVTLARDAGAGFEVGVGLTYLAWSLVEGTTPVPQAMVEIAELQQAAAGDYAAAMGLLGFRGVLNTMAGRHDEARDQMARCRAGIEELGLRLPAAAMADFDARALLLIGDYRGAEAAVLHALEISRGSGDRWFQSTLLVDLAHAILGDGRQDDGARAVANIDSVPAPSDTEWLVRRGTALARLAGLRGDLDAAVAQAAAAVSVADPTEMLTLRTHAHRVLAEVLTAAGRSREAAAAAKEAGRLAAAKGDATTLAVVTRLAVTT